MENYYTFADPLSKYQSFIEKARENQRILADFKKKLDLVTPYNPFSFKKIQQLGAVLDIFYQIHGNADLNHSLLFSFGFHGYIDNITGLQENIKRKKVQFAKIAKKGKSKFAKVYYPPLVDKNPKSNNVSMTNNLIITGPNASGKTTVLKSCLVNVLLSQQVGCGFYKQATLVPYQHIHCYLNIPDTSGRDSLFQAEARRCKEIIEHILENKEERHFCVFDELYSGTNPEEAVSSGKAFLLYLNKFKKTVDCLLTTHFFDLCKSLEEGTSFVNYSMKTLIQRDLGATESDKSKATESDREKIVYTYEMQRGISNVKGGIHVLTDMNYPIEIIRSAIGR
jgi:DNA mismatch repair ATPase MutS